jgi:hypothetical protein
MLTNNGFQTAVDLCNATRGKFCTFLAIFPSLLIASLNNSPLDAKSEGLGLLWSESVNHAQLVSGN